MSFDSIAPHYRWLESAAFANKLQNARVAFLDQIGAPKRVLIVGEGNGRFLSELVRKYPAVEVDCLDASARMLALARKRTIGHEKRVRFLRKNILDWSPERNAYDLIVTHFFLDCFSETTLVRIVEKLVAAASADARWLIADFCIPAKKPAAWRARLCIGAMYIFFRVVAGIEARQLVSPAPILEREGFAQLARQTFAGGMIQSQLWKRTR